MMRLTILIFSLSIYCFDCYPQNANLPEQIALDFFANKIAPIAIPNIKKIYYTGKTDSMVSSVHFKCIENNSNFSNRDTISLINSRINPTLENNFFIPVYTSAPISLYCNRLKILGNKRRLKNNREGVIEVFNAIKIREYHYVHLHFYSLDNAIVSIIIELNQNNDVVNWCYE